MNPQNISLVKTKQILSEGKLLARGTNRLVYLFQNKIWKFPICIFDEIDENDFLAKTQPNKKAIKENYYVLEKISFAQVIQGSCWKLAQNFIENKILNENQNCSSVVPKLLSFGLIEELNIPFTCMEYFSSKRFFIKKEEIKFIKEETSQFLGAGNFFDYENANNIRFQNGQIKCIDWGIVSKELLEKWILETN